MSDKRGIGWLGAVVAAAVLTGCAEAPKEQLEAAQQAVEAAQTAGAPDYAKEEFTKLEQEFTEAKEEIANQEKAFALFRSYGKADEMLKRVAQHAKEVEEIARMKKAEAKAVAESGEKEAQTIVASVQELVAQAPVGKERAAVEAIKADLNGLQGRLGTIHSLIEKGDYAGAEAQAKALKEKGALLSQEIQKAIEKVKGAKGRSSRGIG